MEMGEECTWSLADAKARLSEVLERAQSLPQVLTRRGKPLAVVVSVDEWERKTKRRGALSEFFRTSPLGDSELEIERVTDSPRDVSL